MKPAFGLLSKLRPGRAVEAPASELLNLGCGARFHPAWTNVDFQASAEGVLAHDLRTPFPFPAASFAAVYSSHVLEHFSRAAAPVFLKECHRVLKPGGVLRVAVPDLEVIARLYLQNLEGAAAGDRKAADRHEWMTLELLDQMVREQSGGEMRNHWMQNPLPEEEFILQRFGWEVKRFLDELRGKQPDTAPPSAREIAAFRESGELHKWMYDRVSLRALLETCGFSECKVCAASESRIPNFNSYWLDLNEDGSVRKPDSLFMEASRP